MYLLWRWIGNKMGKPYTYEKRITLEVLEHYDSLKKQFGKAFTNKMMRKLNE